MGNEFETAIKRFSEARDILEKCEKAEDAAAYLQNETGLPFDECMKAYEFIMGAGKDEK